jgi:hypothetical protein
MQQIVQGEKAVLFDQGILHDCSTDWTTLIWACPNLTCHLCKSLSNLLLEVVALQKTLLFKTGI